MTTETYKLNAMGGVQRLSDGAFIPEDARNADWRAFQAWVAEGNTPQPADTTPTAQPFDHDAFVNRLTPAEETAFYGWLAQKINGGPPPARRSVMRFLTRDRFQYGEAGYNELLTHMENDGVISAARKVELQSPP